MRNLFNKWPTLAFMASLTIGAATSVPATELPPSITACAGEGDSTRRLACFDREVATYRQSKPAVAAAVPPAPRAATAPAAAPPEAAPAAAQASAVRRGATSSSESARAAGTTPTHVSARVVSVDRHPDGFAVHLDNGQVWENSEAAPDSINVRVGDEVSVDRSMGSYWISGRVGEGLKVRQKLPAPVDTN